MNKIVGLIYLVTLFQERCFAPTTSISPDGCIIDGRHFRPGEDISRGTFGLWCFGSYCSENGEVISWDEWNCNNETPTWPNIQKPSTTQQESSPFAYTTVIQTEP
ncbi:hypothetical protein ACJMK2_030673 [Sinanodonta woodiana]|uniref:Secreted protein n=1 Tax=Sinanodonta woodiana TaxID=1069815 RepID=A0ABD3WXS1_SINWO